MKKIFSYIYPFTLERRKGKLSEHLEVAMENGRKVLNAGRVNYSFGSLHHVFQVGLKKANLEKSPPENILILGFGVGSIVHILRNEMKITAPITGIEADEEVIRLGKEHFDTGAYPDLRIIHDRAENFVESCTEKFDLILVDVFVEEEVPAVCRSIEFLKALKRLLLPKGRVIFNYMPQGNLSGRDMFEERFAMVFPEHRIDEIRMGDSPNHLLVGTAL